MPKLSTRLLLAAALGIASLPAITRSGEFDALAQEFTPVRPVDPEDPGRDASSYPEAASFAPQPFDPPPPSSRPEPLPAEALAPAVLPASPQLAPLAAAPQIAPLNGHDAFLGAIWRLQERLDQLEHENRRLNSNLHQLQGTPALLGRSSRYFQLSPLRNPEIGGLGAAPVHYETGLSALEQPAAPDLAAPALDMPPDSAIMMGETATCPTPCPAPWHHGVYGDGCGCAGVFEFSIDWLNWKANRGGLDFLVSGDDDNAAIGPGNLKRIRTGRDNGLRLALFRRTEAGWDFGIRYTEFDLQGRNSVFDPDAAMTATRIHPTGADIGDADIATAHSRYQLRYDIIDLEAGRSFGVGSSGAVRPFAALRAARIDQDLHTMYSDTPGFVGGNLVIVSETANTSSVGMLAGSEAHWHFREIWNVFGRAAGGVHVGTSDVANFQFEPDNGNDINVQVKDDHRDVLMSFEAAAGVGCRLWDRRWAAVDLEVGYEIQYWDNLPDFIRFVDDANDGLNDRSTTSLGLDGLFGRLVITR